MNQATGSAGQAGFQSDAGVREQVGAVGGGGGQSVAAFIFGVAVVAFDPGKGDGVRGGGFQEAFPEVYVFNGAGGSFPVFFEPAVYPVFVEGVRYIFGSLR